MAEHDGTLADRPGEAALRLTRPPIIDAAAQTATIRLDARAIGRACLLGAAHQMTDRAFVRLGGSPDSEAEVVLASRTPAAEAELDALARDFLAELGTQTVRWAIARSNLPLRRHVVGLALTLSEAPDSARPRGGRP